MTLGHQHSPLYLRVSAFDCDLIRALNLTLGFLNAPISNDLLPQILEDWHGCWRRHFVAAFKIRKHIREEIGDSKFSILVDETCDVAKREQMALILRFVDKNGILQERFFDLIHVANTRSFTLKMELCFALSNHEFDIQYLATKNLLTRLLNFV